MAKISKSKSNKTPVVAVMGHVDHGKTSLLDVIRNSSIQESEVGGITQNTRAHQIGVGDAKITFLDTPGHEAFTEMRSRGAKVTDMVMLVVAADDGVQPQTVESIKFAKESKVPIIVAINKIDLPGANPSKVKQELSQYDVLVEEFGGDTLVVEVSAKQKKNIDELLETILLQAEVMELSERKVAQGTAEAVILESTLDETKGPISLVLIKAGEIKIGDYIVYPGKATTIRSIQDEFGKTGGIFREGDPAWIIGLDDVLKTGELILFEKDQKKARELAGSFEKIILKEEKEEVTEELEELDILAQMFGSQEKEDNTKYLQVVLKTDTQGTLEAVREKLNELDHEDVKINILSDGTGKITEKDVLTAKNAKGIVIGFQVLIPGDVQIVAKRERVLVKNYEIIYQLLEEVEMVLESMLTLEEEIVEVAKAQVKQVFVLSDGSKVAGSKVTKGTVIKGYKCFVMRGDEEIGNGKIISLKQLKKEVKEVKKEQECGIIIEPEIDVQEGDEVVCYKIEKS
jgi:translation initiation factor IF-2